MRKFIEWILVAILLVIIAYTFTYAFDNDPSFQLSQTYQGR